MGLPGGAIMIKSAQIIGLVASMMIAGIVPSFAITAAPAPELGGTAFGMFLAAGIAVFIRKRRKQ
jgi:hypothetical protein